MQVRHIIVMQHICYEDFVKLMRALGFKREMSAPNTVWIVAAFVVGIVFIPLRSLDWLLKSIE